MTNAPFGAAAPDAAARAPVAVAANGRIGADLE
jgi:hypothetical protein